MFTPCGMCNANCDLYHMSSPGRIPRRKRAHPRSGLLLLALACAVGGSAVAQGVVAPQARVSAARTELENARVRAEQLAAEAKDDDERARLQGEAQTIARRLAEGDFEPGDRVVLVVEGDTALTDTFTVRDNRMLVLDRLPELSLAGVLRSESQERIAAHVARYLRDPVVRVTPLVRVGIVGEVQRQGFYSIPADVPIGDAIMLAGGLSERADIQKTEVRRGKDEILTRHNVRNALRAGATLDQLNLRAGDQIVVGGKTMINWENALRVTALLAGVYLSLR